MVTQTITLSMIPGGVTPRIYASQNDHGLRVFVFNLVDENGGYAIPSGTTALLNVLKPDRTVVSETCTWSGSTVTADCTEQMTAVAGNVHCEVRLVAANGDAVGSANFILGVESNPLASGVVSESDFDSISDMVDRAVAAASIPPTYVTDWLDENITQETGYVIDQSLTIENAAADAKATGDMIRASFVVGEASGSIASFADGADNVPVKDLVVNIQPKQAGTGDPSPSNVRAISGWTSAKISATGQNLLPVLYDTKALNGTTRTVNGVTFTINDDGTISVNGTATTGFDYIMLRNDDVMARLESGKSYTISGCPSGGSSTTFSIRFNVNGQYDFGSGATFTYSGSAPGNMSIRIQNGATLNNLVFKPMLCLASDTDREFEPFGTQYNITFGTAGTVYGGTLDVTSGMLTVDHGVQTLTGTESVYYNTSSVFFQILDTIPTNAWETNNICNYYRTTGTAASGNYCQYGGDKQLRIYDFAYTDAASYKAWLAARYAANAPVTVVYPLAQPVSYQLTPTEVKTLLGNNNIFADTGSVASCEYRADTKLYLEKLTNPDDDMVANANITSGSYFMVGNNLYLATANIANGGAITPGTNCTATNLAAALNAINS